MCPLQGALVQTLPGLASPAPAGRRCLRAVRGAGSATCVVQAEHYDQLRGAHGIYQRLPQSPHHPECGRLHFRGDRILEWSAFKRLQRWQRDPPPENHVKAKRSTPRPLKPRLHTTSAVTGRSCAGSFGQSHWSFPPCWLLFGF